MISCFSHSEKKDRPAAVEKAEALLKDVAKKVAAWEVTHSHITEEERNELLSLVDKARDWIRDNVEVVECQISSKIIA